MGGGGEVEDGGGQVHKGPNWRCKKAQVVRRPKLLSALCLRSVYCRRLSTVLRLVSYWGYQASQTCVLAPTLV